MKKIFKISVLFIMIILLNFVPFISTGIFTEDLLTVKADYESQGYTVECEENEDQWLITAENEDEIIYVKCFDSLIDAFDNYEREIRIMNVYKTDEKFEDFFEEYFVELVGNSVITTIVMNSKS